MDTTFLQGLTDLGNRIVQAIEGRQKNEQPENEPEKEKDMTEPLTVAEFMQTPEAEAELERRANERADTLLKAEQLKSKAVEFARKLTAEGEYALALKADELTARILALPESEKVMELVGLIADAKIVNFSERGHNGKEKEEQTGAKLPEAIEGLLSAWVKAGKSPEEFFAVNPELGQASEYDLSAYQEKEG